MLMESRTVQLMLSIFFLYASACSSGNDGGDGGDKSTEHDSDSATLGDSDSVLEDSASNDDDSVSGDTESDEKPTDTSPGTDDSASDTVEIDTSGCGNGVIEKPGEVCDDGNSSPGDGCSALCDAVEDGYLCYPGEPCIYTVECGDGQIGGTETCDDHNTDDNDGCSADCKIDEGWSCPVLGENCVAAACGDGIVAGKEECDDGNEDSADGCSDTCHLEAGWACDTPGADCHETVCGDGVKEGSEFCDDGNLDFWDGCSEECEVEPDCGEGACVSSCGDGFMLPGDNEECDDGNLQNNDGCSATCQKEDGFTCDDVEDSLPDVLEVSIVFRDFIGLPTADATRHPDFERYSGGNVTYGLVENILGEDGKPVYTGICETGRDTSPPPLDTDSGDTDYIPDEELCPYDDQTTSKEAFDQWYNDDPDVNITVASTLSLNRQAGTTTYFYENDNFYPLDDAGWVAEGSERASFGVDGYEHNHSFTSELRYWFKYEGNESLEFRGDDDVWVFINNQLAVDIGGLHPSQIREIILDGYAALEFGLEVGQIYEIVLFHAERHTDASRFNLTLSGFTKVQSQCETQCGDGIVAGDETCDDGKNDGSYGGCNDDCTRGPRCGDGEVQEEEEACDDGENLTVYSPSDTPGCAPGCVYGAWCGDGVLNGIFGEQCDDGVNEGGYGKCASDCTLDARCGDKTVQPEYGEECDDGNTVSGDGCALDCKEESVFVE